MQQLLVKQFHEDICTIPQEYNDFLSGCCGMMNYDSLVSKFMQFLPENGKRILQRRRKVVGFEPDRFWRSKVGPQNFVHNFDCTSSLLAIRTWRGFQTFEETR